MKVGKLTTKINVIQGGMGVGVSLSNLAGSVAKCGGIGTISTAQIGYRDPDFALDPIATNLKVIEQEIKRAKEIADGGIIAVNIMVATREYERYVRASVAAGVDIVASGAGLPMNLPELVEGSDTLIAPICSSRKSFDVLTKYWLKKYDRLPDLVVIEGPKAGGHLGFKREEIDEYTDDKYDEVILSIIEGARLLGESQNQYIPVAVAGGIYDRADYDHAMELGADAVQMGTRFVTTVECDASQSYKEAYLKARKEDIEIIKSPVGLPGRAIHNDFIDRVNAGERFMDGCKKCVKTCNPGTTPYCITKALVNAVSGNVDEGLIFCGSNAYRADHIENVADIMEEFS